MAGGDAIDNLLQILKDCCPDVARRTVLAQQVNTLRQSLGCDGEQVVARMLAEAGVDSLEEFVASHYAEELANRLDREEDPCSFRWQRLNLIPLPGLETMATVMGTPLQVIVAVLQFMKGILDILSSLLLAIPDPLKALILAAYTILKEIVDNLLATGCYLYFDAPGITSSVATLADMGMQMPPSPPWLAGDAVAPPPGPADGFACWAHTFGCSFDDPGDDNRPVFTEGAIVEAVFIIAAAPRLVDLRPILTLFARLLDLKAFENAWDEYVKKSDDPDRARLARSSVAPDWRSWKLRDMGPEEYPLRKLEQLPEMLKGLLQDIDNIVDLIRDLIRTIGDKIDILLELAKIIQGVIDMLAVLSTSGLHCLRVVTDQGVTGLKKAFLEAKNRPCGNTGSNACGAVAGVCLLGGVGEYGSQSIPVLWSLLGLDGVDACIASFKNPFSEKGKRMQKQAEESWADTKAMAGEAWNGAPYGDGSAENLGIRGLWGALGSDIQQQQEALLKALGLGEQEADALLHSDRNSLIRTIEESLAEGMELDPHVLAHVEATRRARRRGHRSLGMAFGTAADKDTNSR